MQNSALVNIVLSFLLFFSVLCLSPSCSGSQIIMDPVISENMNFLQVNPESDETYRVLITSDDYMVSQMKFQEKIRRIEDKDGDINICEKLEEYDKIDEIRDGIISIWLFPDSGKLMKIRPKVLTYLIEIDNLIVEDIKRWDFEFSDGVVYPNNFDIKYRVILRKNQSDYEILKEVRDRELEEKEKKEKTEKPDQDDNKKDAV